MADTSARPRLVPELKVVDIARSLAFWCDIIGFDVRFDRPEDGFAYLNLEGAEIMLDQRGAGPLERRGIWETGPMEHPFGRGINFQINCTDYDGILARLTASGVPIYFGPEERWYRTGDKETGVRQFLAQDPDGYLLRVQQVIGTRSVPPR